MLEMNLLSQFILLIKNLALATSFVSATSFYFGRLQSASVTSNFVKIFNFKILVKPNK